MSGIWEDLRYALRALHRSPGFALAAIATLAVGIGVNAAVFTLANAALFRGFPGVADNDRIVYVASRRSACCLSYPDFEDWRAQARSFEGMAAVRGVPASLSDGSGWSEGLDATEVSADAFRLVSAVPLLGRDFSALDEAPGAAPVAILSHALWQRRYGRDEDVVGRMIRVNGTPTTVVGVMPATFSFPQKQDLWLPLVRTRELEQRDRRDLWFAFGRLAPGTTVESARAELDAIGRRLAAAYPATNRDYLPEVRTFNEFFVGANENRVYVAMWGAVAFVLLIACANLANLMLARAAGRAHELSVRMALGAGAWRVGRQLLIESVLLAAAGGALGWWIAKWTVAAYALAERGPGRSPWRVLDYSMDYEVLTYLAAVAAGTGMLFGLAPVRRVAKLDVRAALQDTGRGASTGRSGKRLSATLVSVEVALAVVLLVGAGLMIRSFVTVASADPGVRVERVLTGLVELPQERYATDAARVGFYDALAARLEAVPGVESVASASALPTWGARRVEYELAEASLTSGQERPVAAALAVSEGYFDTLGAPVLAGREIRAFDRAGSLPVALVNERFASRHWPGEDAVGKRLRLLYGAGAGEWLTVVGVVGNIVQSQRQELEPIVYVSSRQAARTSLWMLVRTRVPPGALADDFRREVQALDPDLPVLLGPYTLADRMAEAYWDTTLYAVLFAAFAGIALLLAALGLYAVMAYAVSRGTQEMGIRMAVGADARHIRALVMREAMLPLAVGLAIGLAGAAALTRVLDSTLVQVSAMDPVAVAAAAAVLALSGALGAWFPARRAARVSPMVVLRR